MLAGIFEAIREERTRQDSRWGRQEHGGLYWLAIAGEEFGEVARALVEGDEEQVSRELIQLAAVVVAWLECVGRRGCGCG
jgi:NTP pyrophosphatase (non-canonical NTP hydrolase)